ncbi:MAG: FdhF/YdeP family oxidoreductase [Pseudomonadales bacterium]|nr:FdhF/YdeP family oxidoreductase [Pseudomonadales bacterium]MBO6595830.1 FdhF/YdeP family oxidoreductase [Pseudomonadales bacterium]MBO6702435.1 FdhF/YdeP family oxidoreductase [Pseudomonadales bacterium]
MTNRVNQPKTTVGGGMKKVLYTLEKVRAMGVSRATKALVSKNTCKACGLGMGGQLGGMTNEAGEFPAVCNKSVQAQSSDTQPEIPVEIFQHTIEDLKELSEREMNSLGRLNTPLYKAAGADRYEPVDWDEALAMVIDRFQQTDAARSFFYSSGRSSNEAGFLLQLFARLFGTNNVNNCSYYCHQATGVALAGTIGAGTATVELEDLPSCDLFFLIGANPASNHPRLLHQLKTIRDRGGKVVVINPAKEPGLVKFAVPKSPASLIAGGTEIASHFLQPNIGTDYLLLQGIAKAVIEKNGEDQSFIAQHLEGYSDYRDAVLALTWEDITQCGISQSDIEEVAELYIASQRSIFAWGMGITHHLHGVENVEQIANLALLRGMVGRPAAGLLPLRGHSNVQGIGTIGVKPVLADEVMQRMSETFGVTLPNTPGMDTMASMQAAHAGDIDLALIMGGNLYASNPDARWAAKALGNIKSKVFLTTTLNRGHVYGCDEGESLILPVTARDEEWQPTTQESMFNFVRLSDGGIYRLSEVKPESWIICQIAAGVLSDCPVDFHVFESHQNVRQAIAKIIPELEELADIEVAKKEFHIKRRILHEPEFNTTSGKASFAAVCTQPKQTTEFMMSTVRSEGQFNSIVYEDDDVYRGTTNRWVVMMSPKDMARLGVNAGNQVTLKSKIGEMPLLEVVPFDIQEGNLMCYYPEANIITSTEVDPRSKTPTFKATPVEVIV